MLSKINRCDIYIITWCVYLLQDVLYVQGVINQVLQVVLMLWGLIVSREVFKKVKTNPSVINIALVLIIMYIVYGLGYMMFGQIYSYGNGGYTSSYGYLQSSMNSIIPFFLFYIYSKKGFLTYRRIKLYLPLFILCFIFLYYQNYQETLYHYSVEIGSKREEFTNNVSYYFLLIIPFVFFYKDVIIRYVFSLILMYFIIAGMKRGAIIIGGFCFLYFLWVNFRNYRSWSSRFLVILITISFILSTYELVESMYNSSEYFTQRIEQTIEGDISGRDEIYPKIWKGWYNSESMLNIVFGYGANSTVKFSEGWFAHQDWLETICNNGLLGITILFFFYFSLVRITIKSKKLLERSLFFSFVMMTFICIAKSFFSMSIQDMQVCQTLLLGYFTYNYKCKQMINK